MRANARQVQLARSPTCAKANLARDRMRSHALNAPRRVQRLGVVHVANCDMHNPKSSRWRAIACVRTCAKACECVRTRSDACACDVCVLFYLSSFAHICLSIWFCYTCASIRPSLRPDRTGLSFYTCVSFYLSSFAHSARPGCKVEMLGRSREFHNHRY
jgi:hypothetical protein